MNTSLTMDAELFQHPLSLKHELNLQWRDPVGQLKIPPRDTDPRFPCRREKGSFAFARASDGPGAPGWPKVGADRLKIRVQKVNGDRGKKSPSSAPWEPWHPLQRVHTLLLPSHAFQKHPRR